MQDCLFCKIASGEIPSVKVYEDRKVLAFKDINPQSKVHLLVIPKEHFSDVLDCAEQNEGLLGYLYKIAAQIAIEQGLSGDGFRLVTNCGEHGRQSVHHFHIHILGGEKLSGQMG